MPPAKKRKVAPSSKTAKQDQQDADIIEDTLASQPNDDNPAMARTESSTTQETAPAPLPTAEKSTEDAAAKAKERMARFRALQERAKSSSDQNLKAANAESQRLAADPSQLAGLRRKHAVASQKLMKAEIEDEGGDFERKRAWDWTVDESERWDKRVRKKEAARDDSAFQDYRREAQKVYKRQLRNVAPDMERYARDKMAAIEKAAAEGSLEIVETEDGELIAIDKDGSFYATADSTSFADSKPSKEAIDRLVNDQRKADEVAARKRKERMAKNGDDADVTYINEKNKQFNQKLARFYNKYTAEIRDSFERGTMI
jgi:pre-mRNA-splicing factor SYF2